jgi:hypothetical protein
VGALDKLFLAHLNRLKLSPTKKQIWGATEKLFRIASPEGAFFVLVLKSSFFLVFPFSTSDHFLLMFSLYIFPVPFCRKIKLIFSVESVFPGIFYRLDFGANLCTE